MLKILPDLFSATKIKSSSSLVGLLLFFTCISCSVKTDKAQNVENREILISEDSIVPGTTNAKSADWIGFEYDEARMYLYGTGKNYEAYNKNRSIIVDGRLNSSVADSTGVILSQEQISKVNAILSGNYSEEKTDDIALCFVPHHGLVFYKEEVPVAYASICLTCHALQSYPTQGKFHFAQLQQLIQELGLPTDVN